MKTTPQCQMPQSGRVQRSTEIARGPEPEPRSKHIEALQSCFFPPADARCIRYPDASTIGAGIPMRIPAMEARQS
jgi:hypothetical protein